MPRAAAILSAACISMTSGTRPKQTKNTFAKYEAALSAK